MARKREQRKPRPAPASKDDPTSKIQHGRPDLSGNIPVNAAETAELKPSSPFPIVGIGASAGGLEAFTELLKNLPVNSGMAFVLVQHLDPQHESVLTQILTRATSMPVREVTDNLRVLSDHVYVIPPNTSLAIVQGILQLQPRPAGRTPFRSIDSFFESLAQDSHERSIGVILSGTATDGTLGLEAIKAEGGITFAQDDSARFDSMPRSAVAAGCVDFVLSPKKIAQELARIATHPFVVGQPTEHLASPEADHASASEHADAAAPLPSGGHGAPRTGANKARAEARQARGAKSAENGFKQALLLLRNHSGVDFSLYKSTTIQRRISRRMVLNRHERLEDYAEFLRGNVKELDALYSDVLISVTSFFRNPETFDVLKRKVFPNLLEQRSDTPVRVWVLGCSTGQEAYSIAMTFAECVEKIPQKRGLQVFATDLNDALLDKARQGLYAKTLAQDISPERLRRFFVEEQGGFRIVKSLREMVVFARQNLISDPPFSHIDLISCRNLLIYLESSLQRRALPMFHYALNPEGLLFLGASESIGSFTDLFESLDKKHKIFTRKPAAMFALPPPMNREHRDFGPSPAPPLRRSRSGETPLLMDQGPVAAENGRCELNAQREADRVAVNQYAPPGVLINADLQVLQFRGSTSAYLGPPKGKASFDVLKMAHEGLILPLRAAINQAKKDNKPARKENIKIRQNGDTRTVNVGVIPLKNLAERCFLIVFEDAGTVGRAKVGRPSSTSPRSRKPAAGPSGVLDESARNAELVAELSETRDYLQSIQEKYEAANEELQASSEEVQSANEELQSINEELETSKEELESANEELTTVNEEMANRNAELNRLNDDLVNLQNSTHLAILLLGRDLTIRRFSPQAEKAFGLVAGDVGRSISGIRHDFRVRDLGAIVAEVIDTVRSQAHDVQDQGGHWWSLRVRPYMTVDNKVDGAVLVLVDIDLLKRSEQAIAAARDSAQNTIETVRGPFVVLDAELRVQSANRSFYRDFRVAPADTVGKSLFDLGNQQWDIPRLRTLLEETLADSTAVDDFQVEHDFPLLGRRTMLLNARRIIDPAHGTPRILLAVDDVTERKRAEELLRASQADLREADRRKNEFLAMLAHELRNPLAPIRNAVQILQRTPADAEAVSSASEMIDRQVGQMVRMVEDLLDISRITRGKIELRKGPVELGSAVHHAAEATRALYETRRQELTVTLTPQPIYLNADPTRLAQIVGNLLNNACKFTDQRGRISLVVEREGTQAVIRVKDNGIGIAAEQLPRIFEMFVQVDTSLERSVSGLGIGLTLVKNLVQMHGGTIEAHSAGIGRGSEFVVRLPIIAETAELPPQPPVSEPTPTAGRRILVVDDNRDSAASLAMLLKLCGNETRTAYDGQEAVEAAATFNPDLVLMDIGLPKLNGYEACRRIREQPRGKSMVLVALTGWGQDEDRQKSKEAGFSAHMVKPVELPAVMNLLAGLMTHNA